MTDMDDTVAATLPVEPEPEGVPLLPCLAGYFPDLPMRTAAPQVGMRKEELPAVIVMRGEGYEPGKEVDLQGTAFTRILAEWRETRGKDHRYRVRLLCQCGEEVVAHRDSLPDRTVSCGCSSGRWHAWRRAGGEK